MDEKLFQIVVGIIGIFGGWILKTIWAEIKILQANDQKLNEADKELTEKIHEIDKLVAGDYVRRDYFDAKITAMFQKLDTIVDVLNKKADRN